MENVIKIIKLTMITFLLKIFQGLSDYSNGKPLKNKFGTQFLSLCRPVSSKMVFSLD